MRRRLFHRLALSALAAACLATTAPQAQAQDNKPEDQLINTADGVKLNGILYKSANSKNGSCVIIIHEPFTDPTKGDWDGLAKTLAAGGYHVLRFDFRGHGKSLDVVPAQFWKDTMNKMLPGSSKTPPRDSITLKDVQDKKNYYPQMAYDISAARNHLDKLNDDSQVNTSSTYLIGAGDAATLGMLFLATEWHREQKKPMLVLGLQKNIITATSPIAQGGAPAGKDYGGAIWLTPKVMSGFSKSSIENWVSRIARDTNGDMRTQTPMLFIHGEKDSAGLSACKYFNDQVMVAGGRGSTLAKLDSTYIRDRKGTDLKGVALLGKAGTLDTEKLILEFLDKMEERRRKVPRITREYTEPMKINIQSFGS